MEKNNLPIDFEKIENPIVRKALKQRHAMFMFNYSDSEHTDKSKRYEDHSEHKEYGDHSDHTESKRYDDHTESFWDKFAPKYKDTSLDRPHDDTHSDYMCY